MSLQRLTINLKPDEMVLPALYRTQEAPGPNTEARRREFMELARTDLTQALEGLQGSSV